MMQYFRRATSRLLPGTLALAALALVAASPASAADGVQFAGNCDSTYVNKKVGDNEQWAITWEIFGNASGNVLKLDGTPPSFIECDLIDENLDELTLTFECYGSSPCTGPPCGDTQWTLISSDIVLPTSFFLPPGVDPEDPFTACEVR
jgi:hypothetical protein